MENEGWQPIETAPKDETEIILYFRGWHKAITGHWCHDAGMPIGGYWYSDWCHTDDDDVPTHWMPLPSKPEGA